jgi:transcriptional regulator with XRE-family HTH domain
MPVLKDKAKRNELRRELYAVLDARGESLPATIKGLRKILALDQEAFAEYVGISLSALRRLEQANGNVTLKTIEKVLKRFNLELNVVAPRRRQSGE